jgi:hypothetical protein
VEGGTSRGTSCSTRRSSAGAATAWGILPSFAPTRPSPSPARSARGRTGTRRRAARSGKHVCVCVCVCVDVVVGICNEEAHPFFLITMTAWRGPRACCACSAARRTTTTAWAATAGSARRRSSKVRCLLTLPCPCVLCHAL